MLLRAQYVLPIEGEPITDGAILVRDGKIADIGPAESLLIRYTDVPITHFEHAALLPGLVDLHTHLEYTAFRGMQHDLPYVEWATASARNASHMAAADWDVAAICGGLEALATGITCVADVTDTGASLRAASQLGLRGVFYREVGAMDRQRIARAMELAENDILTWLDGQDADLISVGIAPDHLFRCHPAVFGEVAEFAVREDMRVALHLADSREEYNFVKYGSSGFAIDREAYRGFVENPPWLPTAASPVKYALNWGAFDAPNVLAIHCVCVDDDDRAILRKKGVSVAVCARSNAQLGKGVAPLRELLRAGLNVGFGTDSPAATDSTDMFMEQRVALLLERALNGREFLDSKTVLRLATMGGAKALGLDYLIGSLEVGKRADIIAVDLINTMEGASSDPVATLVNTCTGSDVLMTMVDGKVRYEKDRWNVDADVARNVARMIGVRAKLAQRMGV